MKVTDQLVSQKNVFTDVPLPLIKASSDFSSSYYIIKYFFNKHSQLFFYSIKQPGLHASKQLEGVFFLLLVKPFPCLGAFLSLVFSVCAKLSSFGCFLISIDRIRERIKDHLLEKFPLLVLELVNASGGHVIEYQNYARMSLANSVVRYQRRRILRQLMFVDTLIGKSVVSIVFSYLFCFRPGQVIPFSIRGFESRVQ